MAIQEKRIRILSLISVIIIIPIGFGAKFYNGPYSSWVNNSFAGVFYEIFWCLVFLMLLPKANPLKIVIWVLVITCILESLQLWHPFFLEVLRDNLIGQTVLGNSFNPSDYLYYFIGCILGWLWMCGLIRVSMFKNNK